MFSWEIDQLIKQYNYSLPSSVYARISNVNQNTQINFVKYDAYSNSFYISTDDGWSWEFRVYRDE
jgi:hypothetical protein